MDIITLTIEGTSFPVARTPVSKLAKINKAIGTVGLESEEGLRALAEAIYWGAKRADPQTKITAEWIDMNLDTSNSVAVIQAFSEFNRPQGKSPAGEATAASQS